jgi:hypothetical protein
MLHMIQVICYVDGYKDNNDHLKLCFQDLFACSLIVPVLAPYLRSLGASHFTIGCLMSLYFGLQLISSPFIVCVFM